ncbi:Tyrocidine synthase III [Variovorax sp. PBS-H4]|uniref:non-ribosomal peptide synthetase n=1 Tax=Variovorax sp. PBS-H4 TaxID=434008 RepID=UPI0013173BC7|nr:non-ribosomal peptide synthetase [Variovorax sp. PBS-H4]VTU40757.1 Tyrocidine synthase III [Variovorax sp. PBS-H4]
MSLSTAQRRLWFLDRIKADVRDAYHISGALEFNGTLDEGALRRALEALVARHEVLRASFVEIDGEPVQRIAPPGPFPLGTSDLQHLVAADMEAERERQVQEECTAPFDLATGPLIRGRLLRLGPQRHTLVLSLHHMVTDGWSTAVLMSDVAAFYTAFTQGLPDPLPALPAQYADHVAEEQERASSPMRRTRLAYWQRQLEGSPELLELPTDHPRPPVQDHSGDHVEIVFPTRLVSALREWAKHRDATLTMALQAGLNVLFSRLSGQQDIVIGTAVANRRRPAYRQAMGFFVNTLALRTDLSDNPTADELLDRVRSIGQSAYLRQDVPFEQVVELVRPARNPSHSPIFQVLMAIQNYDTEPIPLPGATLQLVVVPPHSVASDLMVLLRETADGMVGRIAYATALFDRTTIERWVGYLMRLLEGMACDGTQRVADLLMLGEDERSLLLEGFNATRSMPAADTMVHTLFEAQAARTPEAVALVADHRSWRYAELDAQADRLACRLHAGGLGPGQRAALYIGRGADMIVAMIAVLKCGGAYVPLDPADPADRIARMLDDAAPQVVLTHRRLQAALPTRDIPQLVLDAEAGAAPQPAAEPFTADVRPEHPAYVIYTSGSTGTPKGVAVPHAALVNLIRWQARQRQGALAPRTLQYVALGFDVAFQEIFTTLCGGGALVLIHEGVRRDMSALLRVLRDQRVERLILPFISLQHLAEEAATSSDALPALRQVITGAEQLRIGNEIRALFKRLGTCRLQNQYGPTEYPVATALDLEGPPDSWPLLPSIGRPIDNTVVRILDPFGQPVPIGVKGEIFIGGEGMASGYLGQPALSEAAFVRDAFSPHRGARLYKTGDVGRWRSDGCIDFVSRYDDQVKLRGFRIELGEIEAQLGQHPSVADVAVLLREDDPGHKRLVAYLTLAPGVAEPGTTAALKRYLRSVLPEYMVPGELVVLDTFPLTVNGKVDRRALRPPPVRAEGSDRVMPRSRTEEALWDIWRGVLHTTAFGVEDSFFDLGGHSLLTMQVASRIRQQLGIELSLALLFEHVTIAALAAWLDEALPRTAPADLAPIPRVARGRALPVSLSQRRMWVIQQFDPASVAYNVPVSLRLRGAFDRRLLQAAFDRIVERHEGLRTRFAMQEDEPVQHIAPSLPVNVEQVDLRARPAAARLEEARSILGERASRPFDLTQAPLHHATLVILDESDHVFLWVMHHAITDNWSIAILMRDLLASYASLATGGPAELPPLAIEYADYAAWQRSPASAAQRHHQIDFWVERLSGLQPLNLPTDYVRPPLPSFRGSKVSVSLPASLLVSLRRFCGLHAVTPFVVLLAAFKLMLARHCGSHDIAVGTPIANRHHLATEQLVGTLVNTLVMRTDLSGNPDFSELLQRVRTTALQAYAHQDAPFDEIVEALGQDRRSHPEGLVRTLFNVLNAPLGHLPAVDFSYQEFDLERTAAQFDLSIHVDTEFGHRIHLEYSTDLFAATSAERMLENYLSLVEQVLGHEHLPISDYPLLAPSQLALLRDHWNATQQALPPEPLIHRHLRCGELALRDRAAVIDSQGKRTTYGELNASVALLASALRARGFGRGHRIGLSLARDAVMLTAQLAVLTAGAAYVPLDPGFPIDRLRYMASDAGLSAILVGPGSAAHFRDTGVPLLDPVVLLDEAAASPPPSLRVDPERDARPLDPAYFIYTSGSTGRPKAVAVPHRAVVNFLVAMAREPGLSESDRLVAITTLSFDIAVLELLLPLAVGAQVIVADSDHVADPRQLRAMLERHDATVMQATPSAWRALLDTGWAGRPGFRGLIGGEPLQVPLAEQLLEHCAELWNMYGPTETTVWSTTWRVHAPRHGIFIGRPIANTSVWVLDERGLPCPIGVPGELCIGGLGVALGYHARDALTAERFVADRWRDEADARLYRTGDLCRWHHDGLLEHLGRLDHQVKVRGFRIELGEIESTLLDHPAVAQCAVLTRAEREDDVRLVAYVVPQSPELDVPALREHLQSSLPEYMVPQHLVVLKAMPLLPNGKLDRNALPAPDVEASRTSRTRQLPVTEEEKAIAEIWSELLGVENIEATDNFFELGGHSLLAMRAVTAIKQKLALQVAPRRLVFETLRQVANRSSANRS